MTLRKYLFSRRIIASAASALPVIRATRRPGLGQRTWMLWVLWGLGAAAAVATVRQDSHARRVADEDSAAPSQ